MYNRLRRSLQRRTLLADIAAIASGTAGAQLVGLAFTPIIVRLFGPEAYGAFGAFMAAVSLIGGSAAASYPSAIVLPDNDGEARSIADLCLALAGIVSLMTFAALLFARGVVEIALSFPIGGVLLWTLPPAIFATAYTQVAQGYRLRQRLFGFSAKVALLHAVITNVAKVVLGLISPSAVVLVGASCASIGLNGVLLRTGQGTRELRSTSLRAIAVKYRDFPLYVLPDTIIGAALRSTPILILGASAGPAAAGFFALTNTVVRLPGTLIAGSIRDAVYPRLAELHNEGKSIGPLLMKATLAISAATIAPFALMVAFSPWIFSVVFGNEWLTAGRFCQWAAVAMYFAFVSAPSARSFTVLRRQGVAFALRAMTAAISLWALFYALDNGGDPVDAVAAFSVIRSIGAIVITIYGLTLAHRKNKDS